MAHLPPGFTIPDRNPLPGGPVFDAESMLVLGCRNDRRVRMSVECYSVLGIHAGASRPTPHACRVATEVSNRLAGGR